MTAINIIAGAVYTRGFPLKDKIQLYGMALIFLVLLYNSPAGLVLYWTMNNIFSLLKNIYFKIKSPKKILF
jgi:membrane protein insertase Oxa1/YidC/SpoIIIJ